MPQMMPMYWLFIYLLVLLIYFCILSFFSEFFIFSSKKEDKIYKPMVESFFFKKK